MARRYTKKAKKTLRGGAKGKSKTHKTKTPALKVLKRSMPGMTKRHQPIKYTLKRKNENLALSALEEINDEEFRRLAYEALIGVKQKEKEEKQKERNETSDELAALLGGLTVGKKNNTPSVPMVPPVPRVPTPKPHAPSPANNAMENLVAALQKQKLNENKPK
jgi:hypothetical protein